MPGLSSKISWIRTDEPPENPDPNKDRPHSNVGAAARAAIWINDPTPPGVPELVARFAGGNLSVLITGETGAGKEVLARSLHQLSGRSGPFVAINCASLNESLLASELFGHERGAFTGADIAKPGLLEIACGGTVLLDEIAELSPRLQANLLRVLESRTMYRVGGVSPVHLDLRFIGATHRNLSAMVARREFRLDLYFRLNGLSLAVTPLRARPGSIPRLAARFLAQAMPAGGTTPRLGEEALLALAQHDWPGNVRELRAVMERAALLCNGDEIRTEHLLIDLEGRPGPAEEPAWSAPPSSPSERDHIIAALEQCAGNQTKAARGLGISRATLVRRLEEHSIPRPRKLG